MYVQHNGIAVTKPLLNYTRCEIWRKKVTCMTSSSTTQHSMQPYTYNNKVYFASILVYRKGRGRERLAEGVSNPLMHGTRRMRVCLMQLPELWYQRVTLGKNNKLCLENSQGLHMYMIISQKNQLIYLKLWKKNVFYMWLYYF